MADLEARNRLSKTAKAAADEEHLQPDAEAQEYLGELVNTAAEALGPCPQPADVERAEESFRRLAATVAAAGSDPTHLQEGAVGWVRVSARELQAALVELCPGFWPFC